MLYPAPEDLVNKQAVVSQVVVSREDPLIDLKLGQELEQIAWLLSLSAPTPPPELKQRILTAILRYDQ